MSKPLNRQAPDTPDPDERVAVLTRSARAAAIAALPECDLSGANLIAARMEGADLRLASLQGAALSDVDHSSEDLSGDPIISAFGDASVALPEGMPRPIIGWIGGVPFEFSGMFDTEWRKWRADPEGYAPPPKPEG